MWEIGRTFLRRNCRFFLPGGKGGGCFEKKGLGKKVMMMLLFFFISPSRRLFHLIFFKPERHKDPLARKSSRREREREKSVNGLLAGKWTPEDFPPLHIP